MYILSLDISGKPRNWLTLEEAVGYYTSDKVVWTLGDPIKTFRGGIQRKTGKQSFLHTHSIIAINTSKFLGYRSGEIALSNRTLFGRDKNICAYCGKRYKINELSRDHILPKAQGGTNIWTNVVTSCLDCNAYKGNRTPEQANMELYYTPYVPNLYEHLLLLNRNVLADQMEYLKAGLPKYSRLL